MPAEAADDVLAHIRAIRDAPTTRRGRRRRPPVLERFGRAYPAAMACLADDLC